MSLGAMSAEDDLHFLRECLVQTADLEQLTNGFNPKCVALGRTGSGKSAIIVNLAGTRPNVVRIDPEALSLNYISNSNVLQFFESVGVDLNIFYQLLWRHVLAVEVLKLKKAWSEESTSRHLLSGLFDKFRPNGRKTRALNYLFSFGESFWADTEQRVREVVRSIESSFENSTGLSVEAFKAKLEADLKKGGTETIQETTEIIHRAKKVVQDVQIQELALVLEFLAEDVFRDEAQRYFIVIDDLDTGWVNDEIRFKLIRALIETIRKFRRISNLKIVISLRADVYETMLGKTSVAGFQTEKYEDLLLRIHWTRDDLFEFANQRIAFLFRDQYTSKAVGFYDIFPQRVGTRDTFDYLVDRTLMRPRDLISFMNECISQATGGSSMVGQNQVRNAEAAYSKKRVRSLSDEWVGFYGELDEPISVLRMLPARFSLLDLSDKIIEEMCIKLVAGDSALSGTFARYCDSLANDSLPTSVVKRRLIEMLYVIGAIGVRVGAGKPFNWSYKNEPLLNYESLDSNSTIATHPMLYREFNIRADPSRVV